MKATSYNGQEYPSLKALHKAHALPGINYQVFYSRLRGGMSLSDALSKPQDSYVDRTFSVNGDVYTGIKEFAIAAGLSYHCAVKRCHRGWSDEEIFNGKVRRRIKKVASKLSEVAISIAGLTYPSRTTAQSILCPEIKLGTITARIRHGWTLEEAFGVKPRKDKRGALYYSFDGENLTIKEASRKFLVPESTIRDKIRRGATPSQAVGLSPIEQGALEKQASNPKSRRPRTPIVAFGTSYPSVSALASAFGLDYHLVYQRIKLFGWEQERAVSEPATESVEVCGRSFASATSAWREIGKTSLAVFSSRRSAGNPLEVCLGLIPLNDKSIEVNGEVFEGLAAVSSAFGIKLSTLKSRILKMSLEEAISYNPTNGRYSTKMFEKDRDLASSIGSLYFVEVDFVGGSLHKIGITRRNVSNRFAGQQHRLICSVQGRLEDVYNLEQLLLDRLSEFRYRADEDFDGRTETLLLTGAEESQVTELITSNIAQYSSCRIV
jgi:hypothetical protein